MLSCVRDCPTQLASAVAIVRLLPTADTETNIQELTLRHQPASPRLASPGGQPSRKFATDARMYRSK
jgi:hypothetical protein